MSAVPPPAPAVPDGGADARTKGHLKPRSRWWIVYSVVFGGGIFYYFALQYDDIRRAKHCLIAGIVSLIVFAAAIGAGLLE